ncbi:MAG TPA: class I SAM-dependent methyltransferase [Gammaproteobacteria bacterium]
MSTSSSKRSVSRAQYDDAASRLPKLTVLNYGFASDSDETVVPADAPEFFCLRLYEHVVRGAELQGARVLEVSCGRGGGAAFLARTFGPSCYVGIDLSEGNVRLARERHAAANVEFRVGDAESLDEPDASYDVVINVEASHLYDDRRAFFAEVRRVLVPGGRFCYADGGWRDDDVVPDLVAAGFRVLERRDITANVVRALELDSARRAAVVGAIADEASRTAYLDWSGVVGYRAYRRLADGDARYFSFLLERPAGG